jgi:hypothetical protein
MVAVATAAAALRRASRAEISARLTIGLPFFITHAAGAMLVNDTRNDELEETTP